MGALCCQVLQHVFCCSPEPWLWEALDLLAWLSLPGRSSTCLGGTARLLGKAGAAPEAKLLSGRQTGGWSTNYDSMVNSGVLSVQLMHNQGFRVCSAVPRRPAMWLVMVLLSWCRMHRTFTHEKVMLVMQMCTGEASACCWHASGHCYLVWGEDSSKARHGQMHRASPAWRGMTWHGIAHVHLVSSSGPGVVPGQVVATTS